MTADLVEMSRDEAVALHDAERAGDASAREFFASLFAPGAECFLCGHPTGEGADRRVSLIADPGDPDKVLVVPSCADCAALHVRSLLSSRGNLPPSPVPEVLLAIRTISRPQFAGLWIEDQIFFLISFRLRRSSQK
jgi:hypothetical protein